MHVNNSVTVKTVGGISLCDGGKLEVQSTLVISKSKGHIETLRDIHTSTYQSWESEENNKLNNHI